MKVYIIGDLHGHDTWKYALNKFGEPSEKNRYVILGDYFDSFDISPEKCLYNFNELMDYKDSLGPDSKKYFITLIGNHDYHYLVHNADKDYEEVYTGFCENKWLEIQDAIKARLDNLQAAYKLDYCMTEVFIFSHAGISNSWLNRTKTELEHEHYMEVYEKLFKPGFLKRSDCLKTLSFYYGRKKSATGDDPDNGPLWIRPFSLSSDMYKDPDRDMTYQFVGHTQKRLRNFNDPADWTIIRDGNTGHLIDEGTIVLCDTGRYVTVLDTDSLEMYKVDVMG